jgi:glycosyltransferase involved in cell wall biosynthesis
MIVKNEERNLANLLKSVEGCFDQIHITDTGSTDKTVEIAKSFGATVHHFDWVNDFSAARNYSFSHATTDYIMWMDGDDELVNKEAFLIWKNHVMPGAEYWLATYHYALNEQKIPVASFLRERVVKNVPWIKWKYFVHEGLLVEPGHQAKAMSVESWSIRHLRTQEDLNADKNRNLKMFENRELDTRMTYYYGKELFEADKSEEAIKQLLTAIQKKDLDQHDRILAMQYLCYAMIKKGDLVQAIATAHQGLVLSPTRAEFYCVIGDAYLKEHKLVEAIPAYEAARKCQNQNNNLGNQVSTIFTFGDAYGAYPVNQLARIHLHLGNKEQAIELSEYAASTYGDEESQKLANEIKQLLHYKIKPVQALNSDDIVITCLPSLYEWDEDVYHQKGIGGSETAAVFMAKELSTLTGRRVIVFNGRKETKYCGLVEYRPAHEAEKFLANYKPKLHIAWRHANKLTDAKTLVWSHDLITPGIEHFENYDKLLALSEFHRKFIAGVKNVPFSKIDVTRNGVMAHKLKKAAKDVNKVVYSSSPDRGLQHAIAVVKKARESLADLKLHVYYGLENLKKLQANKVVDFYENLLHENQEFVIMHGNLPQDRLYEEFSTAAAWIYPTDFMETFCITALEMVGCHVYPVVRKFGALADTLKEFEANGSATLLDADCTDYEAFSAELVSAIQNRKFDSMQVDLGDKTWAAVAKQWVERYIDD